VDMAVDAVVDLPVSGWWNGSALARQPAGRGPLDGQDAPEDGGGVVRCHPGSKRRP
jgi:hypothetical protein